MPFIDHSICYQHCISLFKQSVANYCACFLGLPCRTKMLLVLEHESQPRAYWKGEGHYRNTGQPSNRSWVGKDPAWLNLKWSLSLFQGPYYTAAWNSMASSVPWSKKIFPSTDYITNSLGLQNKNFCKLTSAFHFVSSSSWCSLQRQLLGKEG